ncbi:hypothetical protein LCGC14_0764360 [marine sediment metagenome]|uniref:Uncharacterized protein n=1 Tax=marine sediment metagenome TaxID=412755 RepID=A0A0F9SKD3_9ZZZZ
MNSIEIDEEIVNENKLRLLKILADKDSKDSVTVDILPTELESLKKSMLLGQMIEQMIQSWTLGIKEREEQIRIGSIKVYRDSNRRLHLDFMARF